MWFVAQRLRLTKPAADSIVSTRAESLCSDEEKSVISQTVGTPPADSFRLDEDPSDTGPAAPSPPGADGLPQEKVRLAPRRSLRPDSSWRDLSESPTAVSARTMDTPKSTPHVDSFGFDREPSPILLRPTRSTSRTQSSCSDKEPCAARVAPESSQPMETRHPDPIPAFRMPRSASRPEPVRTDCAPSLWPTSPKNAGRLDTQCSALDASPSMPSLRRSASRPEIPRFSSDASERSITPRSTRRLETLRSEIRASTPRTSLRPAHADYVRSPQEQSALSQMRQRHEHCIKTLQEVMRSTELQDRVSMEEELDELSARLRTRRKTTACVFEVREEDTPKEEMKYVEDMRDIVTKAMGSEVEKLREQSQQDLHELRRLVERGLDSSGEPCRQQQAEEPALKEQLTKAYLDMQDSFHKQRIAEDEVAVLRVRLATAEECVHMARDQRVELSKEREAFEEERKSLREKSEQRMQRLFQHEKELDRARAESDGRKAEIAKLACEQQEACAALDQDREVWEQKEVELMQEVEEKTKRLDETVRKSIRRTVQAESDRREVLCKLRSEKEQLKANLAAKVHELEKSTAVNFRLQAERDAAALKEEEAKKHYAVETDKLKRQVAESKARQDELMQRIKEAKERQFVDQALITLPAFQGRSKRLFTMREARSPKAASRTPKCSAAPAYGGDSSWPLSAGCRLEVPQSRVSPRRMRSASAAVLDTADTQER